MNIHDGGNSISVLHRALTLLKRAWNRFTNVDVLPHQLTTKDPISSATLSFVRPPQQQMSMYGEAAATFALPYPPGDGYHAAKAIEAVISRETDGKLRERLQKRESRISVAKAAETRSAAAVRTSSNVYAILLVAMLALVLAKFLFILLMGY